MNRSVMRATLIRSARIVNPVTAGLTQPWNSGPVEGHVNRRT
jgi:transposase